MQILRTPTVNHFAGRSGYAARYVIIHGTAGGSSAQGIAAWFANPASRVSTHYVVGQDGVIVQCVDESDAAWGNAPAQQGCDPWWTNVPNPNYNTISIECVKRSFDNSDALTPAQQSSVFALVKDICTRHSIPMRAADVLGGITGHYSICPVDRKDCPGTFPWSELWTFLGENNKMSIDLSNPDVASYFEASGSNWLCRQTGHILIGDILKFYQSYGQDALCGLTHLGLPLSNETYPYADHQHVAEQQFERGWLRYDPDHVIDAPPGAGNVYLMHIPEPQVAQLQSEVVSLSNQVTTLTTQNQSLQVEVTDLQQKLAASPTPAPVPTSVDSLLLECQQALLTIAPTVEKVVAASK